MDYFWTVCARCGAGHGLEDFARQAPDKHRPLDIQKLPQGAVENHIRTIWTPVCSHCGHNQFHVQLDPEDMIEFWESVQHELLSVDAPVDVASQLRVWKERRRQEESEYRDWQRQESKDGRRI